MTSRLLTSLGKGIVSFRSDGLARNTLFVSVGLGTRAAIQAAYLIVLSRWLGARGYGLFSGWIAVVMLIAPLAGWGATLILSRDVARERSSSRSSWAMALTQIVATGGPLVALVALAATLLPRERPDMAVVLLLGIAELILLPVAQAATNLCLALNRAALAALAMCLVPLGRLLAALALVLFATAASTYFAAWSHLAGSLAGMAICFALVAQMTGRPAFGERTMLPGTLRAGTSFAVGALVSQSYQEVDKALMLQILGAEVAGPYSAAFRVASVFVLPVSALINAAMPALFAARGQSAMLRTIAITAASYGGVAAIAAACTAPLLPLVFGDEFIAAPHYLWSLSLWPLCFALHQVAASALTAADHQRTRVWVEGAGLVLIVLLNIALLPTFGATASAASLLIGELFMALGCWCLRPRATG